MSTKKKSVTAKTPAQRTLSEKIRVTAKESEAEKDARRAASAQVSSGANLAETGGDSDGSTAGDFFAIQQPLTHLVEEYLLTHLVSGRKMTLKVFCERSGMTVANMTAIMNGNRWVAKCSRETIDKLANILEIPVLQIYVLSGFITSKDVIFSGNLEETISAIFRKMAKDQRMNYKVPNEANWNKWPLDAKLALCMMYEEMTDRVLFRYAVVNSQK